MLTDLSDALARLAFSRLAPDRAHPRADLDRLPPLLAHALRQRLDREVAARLDAAAPWVSSVPDLWREDTDVEPRFPADAWAPTLRETSEWLVEALVHPADALPARLPESGETATEEVLDRMRDLGAYPYLTELVERYAEKKDLAGYDRETLHHLIDRVDRRIANELDTEGWRALLGPLYELTDALPEFPDGVPGRVLAEVFAARGRPGLGADVVSREAIGLDALMAYLDEALAAEPEPEEEPPDDPPSQPTEVITMEAPASTSSVPESSIDDAVEVDSPDDASEDADPPPQEANATEDEIEFIPAEHAPAEEAEPDAPLTVAEALAQAHAASTESAVASDTESPETADVEPAGEETAATEEDPVEEPTPPLTVAEALAQDSDPDAPSAEDEPHEAEPHEELEAEEPETTDEFYPAPEPTGPEPPDALESETSTPDLDGPLVDDNEEDEPLWARLARAQGLTPDALAEHTTDEPQPLWRQFASGDDSTPPEPSSDPSEDTAETPATEKEVETRVLGESADQRALYIETLFGGDEANYHRVLALLDQAPDWTEATDIIGREVFRRYHVHIYSEPAASFTDAVERRFASG